MAHHRRLSGSLCYLSPREEEDVERIKIWDNDLEVLLGASMNGISTPASSVYLTPDRPSNLLEHMLMIIDLETDVPIGWCALFLQAPVNRRASLGIIIGEKAYWGRGYGTEAVKLMLDYGFGVLNLNSVELGVYSFNRRAIRCYEKVGFRRIGIHRQARILAGVPHDALFMDILADEFEESSIGKIIRQQEGEEI
jgi:RimJ/RimL family protein N-acetyltransferase